MLCQFTVFYEQYNKLFLFYLLYLYGWVFHPHIYIIIINFQRKCLIIFNHWFTSILLLISTQLLFCSLILRGTNHDCFRIPVFFFTLSLCDCASQIVFSVVYKF